MAAVAKAKSEDLGPSLKRIWPLYLLSALLLIGILIGAYLTWHHENGLYGDSSVTLSNCPESELINCEVVNSSRYSEMFGIPVALFAIPTFLLLLSLIFSKNRSRQVMGILFAVGLSTVFYSVYLAYVSHFKVGYFCLWCMRLYAISLSIPLLTWASLGQNPFPLLRELFTPSSLKSPLFRSVGITFAVLLAVSIGGDRFYRSTLKRIGEAKSAPLLSEDTASLWTAQGFKLPEKVQWAIKGPQGQMTLQEFDLDSRIGKGHPVALIFLSPGFQTADETAVKFVRYFRRQAPQFEIYTVAGTTAKLKPDMIWETYRSFAELREVPLLFDTEYTLSKAMEVLDVPNVALIDGKGSLVTLHLKDLDHPAVLSPQELSGKQLIDLVAEGKPVTPQKRAPVFYASQNLFGKCAPSFTLKNILTGKPYTFNGKSENGLPTLLVFWSSTCSHCQKEIPQMIEHYRSHPGKYNVVTVSHIKPDIKGGFSHRDATLAYAKSLNFPWPILDDGGVVMTKYGFTSTPTTLLLSPEGEVKAGWYSVHADIDQAFEKALPELAATGKQCTPLEAPIRGKLSFDLISPQGKTVSLESIAKKPTLLHFWATWCAPCQEEMPHLLKLAETAPQRGLQVVLVSVEEPSAGVKIKEFLKGYGAKWESYRAPSGGIASEINMGYSVPRTFLLNGKSEILRSFHGGQSWDDPQVQDQLLSWVQ